MAASCCLNSIGVPRRPTCDDRFDLYAPKDFLKADDYVVAIAVSPGLGDGETHARGFAHESEFGELAKIFRTEFGSVLQFGFDGFFLKIPKYLAPNG